jgi:hypothetical protein
MAHPDDGKFVVVQNGQRVSGQLHEKQDTAQAEAAKVEKKRPVNETGQPVAESGPIKVVQNLYG